MKGLHYDHWQWQLSDHLLTLTLDRADSDVNTLSREVLQELGEIINVIPDHDIQALVFVSAKQNGFILGADISEFSDFGEILNYVLQGQEIFSRIERLKIATFCVIDGPCLGGGLELALACRYRIAVDSRDTALGLPEVRLGIHPGLGGTVRLIKRLGPLAALNMMLTGRSQRARQAAKSGLVDVCVPRRMLNEAVCQLVAHPPRQKQPSWWRKLPNQGWLRPLVSVILKRRVAKHARVEHYPAPYALIDLWRRYAGDPEVMYLEEARSVAKLMNSTCSRNLVRVFFLQGRLKQVKQQATTIQRIHVVGAGTMGRDIAAWCALQGMQVTLQEPNAQVLAAALAKASSLFNKKLRTPSLRRAAGDRLTADPLGDAVSSADVVIEAIVEDAAIKKQVYALLEPQLKSGAILASNTSSIPLEELASGLEQPQRFVGIHFFNPVAKMPLVEVVQAKQSSEMALATATSFVQQIKHLPLPVKSAPGFLVNRILMPYLMAAVELVEQGYQPQQVDRAALEFGMPMGPLHLADSVGIDICLSVAKVFAEHFDRPIPAVLEQMVGAGNLGVKSGRGFYPYRHGQRPKHRWQWRRNDRDEILSRLLDPLFAEADRCLAEKIVSDADLVDAGMIFGTGFAPFTGGPMHYRQSTTLPLDVKSSR